MITFGYKNKFSGWIRSIAAIIVGILIVASKHPNAALVLVVKVLAAFLIAAGVVSLVYGIINRERGFLTVLVTNAVIDVVIGIVLFCFPVQIAAFLLVLIGIALLVFGLWEIIILTSIVKASKLGFSSFILPIICALAGLFIILKPLKSVETMIVIAGISMIVYGVSEFLATWRMNRAMKAHNLKKEAEAKAQADAEATKADMENAKEADYEKVDDEKK